MEEGEVQEKETREEEDEEEEDEEEEDEMQARRDHAEQSELFRELERLKREREEQAVKIQLERRYSSHLHVT